MSDKASLMQQPAPLTDVGLQRELAALFVQALNLEVQPQDIDQLHPGQKAILRFSTFNQRTTPELNGSVTRISADATQDQRTGQSSYTIRIGLTAQEIARLGGDVRLVPGMPVEAFLQTGDRRVVSYLIKPMMDQISRAFRER